MPRKRHLKPGRCYWTRSYVYNVFHADEHVRVRLWQVGSDGRDHIIDQRIYATGLTGIGEVLASRRIMGYIRKYGAVCAE